MRIFIFHLVLVGVFASTAIAGGEENVDNIGFMKSPPKELTERFPMCDAFLKVDWLDEERKIGTSIYELFHNDSGEKIKVHALIKMDGTPIIDFNIKNIFTSGKMGVFKKSILLGTVTNNFDNNIDVSYGYNKYNIKRLFVDNKYNKSYGFKRKVCIPYPENKKVYLYELEKVDREFTKEEVEVLKLKISKYFKSELIENIEFLNIIDMNSDGKLEFVSYGSKFIVYEKNGNFYISSRFKGLNNSKGILFKHSKDICISNQSIHFYTTDGENYYFDDICNITEILNRGN